MKAIAALLVGLAAFATAGAQNTDGGWDHSKVRHVLLVSVDGFHAVDYLNCSKGIAGVNNGAPYCPNLTALGTTGVNYVAASTSKPSDSFPGLMTIVTGATPRTMGIYYDVAYDRFFAPPNQYDGEWSCRRQLHARDFSWNNHRIRRRYRYRPDQA